MDVEIENLAQMGVKFIKDCIIGKTLSVEQLEEEGFKGIFVACLLYTSWLYEDGDAPSS